MPPGTLSATIWLQGWCAPVGSAMAVLMPMRLPLESSSTPPELPGLMAASVCSRDTRGQQHIICQHETTHCATYYCSSAGPPLEVRAACSNICSREGLGRMFYGTAVRDLQIVRAGTAAGLACVARLTCITFLIGNSPVLSSRPRPLTMPYIGTMKRMQDSMHRCRATVQ